MHSVMTRLFRIENVILDGANNMCILKFMMLYMLVCGKRCGVVDFTESLLLLTLCESHRMKVYTRRDDIFVVAPRFGLNHSERCRCVYA